MGGSESVDRDGGGDGWWRRWDDDEVGGWVCALGVLGCCIVDVVVRAWVDGWMDGWTERK